MSNSSKKRIANLSPEKLALLMQKLDKVGKDTLRPGIKPRVQKDALCPLSFAQQRLWFLEQLEPGKDTYTIANIIRLDGHLMLEALERSFQEIVDRHETLRTIFVNDQGQAWQRVLPRRPVILPTVDLEQHPVTEREEWVKQVMRQEAQRPFDLERDPLLRVLLLRLGDEEHVMLLSMHHIISDAWSIGVMAREFSLLYAAFADGQASPLKDLAVQYADYVHWQREWLQGEALERQIDYWKHQLGDSVALELPTDCPRPAVQTYHGSQETFQLPRFVTDGLKALSRKEGVTLFMTLLAAFQVLLARSSNQEEVAVGTPIANRTQEELEGLIGFFVNTLVLRTDLSGNPSFRELLKRVKETTLGAYAHQDLPFEQLVGILQPERDLSRSPLFQVMFVFQNIALEGLQLPELALRPMAIENTTAKFDLTLTMMEVEQDLIGTLEYNTDLFKGETIRHLLTRFQHLLEGIVAHPDRLLALLPLYTQEEMWQMVQKLNKAPVRERSEESIQQLIEAQVRRTPDAVAVWQAGEQISYADLNRRANQLARFLQRCGVGPEVPVALCLERRIDLLIGLLGILKAGGVYVPLDPAYPQERIAFALADAQVPVILTQEWLRTRLGEQTCQVICLEQEHGRLVQEAEEDLETAVTRENLAYVIYTSGSTGWPKGVGLVHRGAIELMGWAGQRFGPQRLARVLAGTSICFDLSVFEVFATLGWGGTVVLVENILDWMGEAGADMVTLMNTVPSALGELVRIGQVPPSVRTVNLAGEVFPRPLAEQVYRQSQVEELVNLYGPTEDTTYSTGERVVPGEEGALPIGRMLPNRRGYVLDRAWQPVPPGGVGELYLSGVGLARGYLGRPDLTAERFVANPYSQQAGERMYRTGDMVRVLEDGMLEFAGRTDQQVKVRGYRIELGEIEHILREHEGVQEAVVVVRGGDNGRRLVGYVVSKEGDQSQGRGQELRAYLSERMPAYMVPGQLVWLKRLPVTASGKVDRRKLPEPEEGQWREEAGGERPETEREQELARIWEEVLGVKGVGRRENFFALGGDSIVSLQVVARARQAGWRLTPRQVFQYPTVAQLAVAVERDYEPGRLAAEQNSVIGSVPLTPIQIWFLCQEVLEPHHWNQSVLLKAQRLDVQYLASVVELLLRHHDILRLRMVKVAGYWQQYIIAPDDSLPLMIQDVSSLAPEGQRECVERVSAGLQASLNLEKGPILRVCYFDFGAGQEGRLFIVVHHLAIDGVSWRILLEDFQNLCTQLASARPVQLQEKTTSFQQWSRGLREYVQQPELREELSYWRQLEPQAGWSLPVDLPGGENTVGSARYVATMLSQEETRALLQQVPQAYRTQINEVLLTALAQAASQWSGLSETWVNLEGHGREDVLEGVDISRTVGWFTSLFPVVLKLPTGDDPGKALKAVKEQMRAIPRRGIGYGLLRYLCEDEAAMKQIGSELPAEMSFNYLGQFDQIFSEQGMFGAAEETSGLAMSPRGKRPHILDVTGSIVGGQLRMTWLYSANLHREETITRLAERFAQCLRSLIMHCSSPEVGGYTPSDFPLAGLDQGQIDHYLGQDRQVEMVYPLTFLQQGLLFHALYAPERGDYVIQVAATFKGQLNVDAFQRAWQQILDHHPILRTAFLWEGLDQPLQIVRRRVELPFAFYDWRTYSSDEQRVRITDYRQADRTQGFVLSQQPLMRLMLFRLTEDTYEFLWSHHHILLDGWSLPILLQDAFVGYEAFCSGRAVRLEQSRQYQDYVSWLVQQDQGKADAFWQQQLEGFTEPTILSNDRASFGAIVSGKPAYEEQTLSLTVDISQKLQHLARRHQLTLNTLVQGAWAFLLSCYSGKQDVLFGVTVSGRPADLAGVETMVGLFINTLPARVRVRPEISLLSWLKALQEQFTEIRQYEYSSLAHIQDRSQVAPGTPLFEYLLAFENYPIDQTRTKAIGGEASLSIEALSAQEQTNYPLTLVVLAGQSLVLRALYDLQRFEATTVTRLLGHVQVILEQMLTGIEQELGRCSLVSTAEREYLLSTLNATQTAYPREATIQGLFEEQVQRTPFALALVSAEGTFTYEQLNQRANQLAHYLLQQGIEPEALVGLCMERSPELIIAILGILKAGGAYLPLDPAYPKDRLAVMLSDAHCEVLLVQAALQTALPGTACRSLIIESEATAIAQCSTENPRLRIFAESLAYVMYTSGSTGVPKGVSVTQRSVVRLVKETNFARFTADDIFLQLAPISFDASTLELWGSLLNGAQLVLFPERTPSLEELAEVLRRYQISILWLTAGLFHQMVEHQLEALTSVEQLLAGGDVLAIPHVKRVLARAGENQCTLINGYGPTENTTFTCCYAITDAAHVGSSVPIGSPIANTTVYLLDAHLHPVPIGVVGELYTGGAGLARGYFQQPSLTAERFIPHPWSSVPGQRLYRTGDLARYLPDGTIEFLGRLDRQVKVRGYRIELSEIENVLLQHPAVQNCVAVVREELSIKRIVAYVVLAQATPFEREALRGFLQERLPEYMVPATFVVLEALPLNVNGKVDRHALPDPDYAAHARTGLLEAARTPVEKALIDIWQQVLGVQEIGIQDNFFMLGGDSILSIQIISRAVQVGIHLTPKLIFEHPTVADLARVITNVAARPVLEAVQGIITGDVPLTPIQHWFFEQRQPQQHHWNQAVLLSVKEQLDLGLLKQLVAALLEHHDALRTRFLPKSVGWRQVIEPPDATVPCSVYDLSLLPEAEQAVVLEAVANEVQASLDLLNGPLLRVAYFKCGDNRPARLLIVIHHLVIDGVSWRILLEDINTAYVQLKAGLRVQLPMKTLSFQQWSQRLQVIAQGATFRQELDYWLRVAQERQTAFPVDWEEGREQNTVSSTRSVAVSLTVEETWALLHRVPGAYRTQINDVLLTALAQGMSQWTRQPSLRIHLEGHGREGELADADLSRTVGWFTSLYPVVLDVERSTPPGEALKIIKESLRALPSNGLGYGLLRYLSADDQVLEQMRALPEAEMSFNYLGQFDAVLSEDALFNVALEASGGVYSPLAKRHYLLEVVGSISGGQLYLNWTYSERIHRQETIEKLADDVLQALRVLIAHCQSEEAGGYTLSDFPLARLTQTQIDAVLGNDRRVEAVYPLTPLQQGMLFHALYAPEGGDYITQVGYTLRGKLDVKAFEDAWQQVIDEHHILRTALIWKGVDEPHQVVYRPVKLPFALHDWRHYSQPEQQQRLLVYRLSDRSRGFDLSQAPLLRVELFWLDEQMYECVWSHHHMLLDGWSMPLVLAAVFQCYQARSRGEVARLPGARPYQEYIGWLVRQDMGRAEAFWREQLAGFPAPNTLRSKRFVGADAALSRPRYGKQQQWLPAKLTNQLQNLARERHLTLNTLMQGAWALLVSRYSGQEDVVFGVIVAGRTAEIAGIEEMVGLFINTLPLRVRVDAGVPLVSWLERVQQCQREISQYEYSPLAQVQGWSEVPRGVPLFESLFVFENYPQGDAVGQEEQELEILKAETTEQTNYPLTLYVQPGERMGLQMLYDYDYWDEKAAESLLGHLQHVLEEMVSAVEQPTGRISLLGEEERRKVVQVWSGGQRAELREESIQQIFEQQVRRTPDAVAVWQAGQQISYAELNRRANQLARFLQRCGVGPEVPVALCLERRIDLLIGLLGILKAGGAYVPLDPAYPQERLTFALADAQVPVVVTQADLRLRLEERECRVICLEQEQTRLAQEEGENLAMVGTRENLAYVIYTSGSTGIPKGVGITHRSAVEFIGWAGERFGPQRLARVLANTSVCFDLSIFELFVTLGWGGTVVLVENALSWVEEEGADAVTLMNTVPSAMGELVRAGLVPAGVRTVNLAGEALARGLVEQIYEQSQVEEVVNLYGPTEDTTYSTEALVQVGEVGGVPIGRPLPNTQGYVLDRTWQPVPQGGIGELYLSGEGLARGYLGRPELTAERFVANPYSGRTGARMYRTGDLVRSREDGVLEYLGRADQQVKVRGYRIELGEIEQVLKAHEQVREAAVVVREEGGSKQLVGYVVREQEEPGNGSGQELREYLRERLPDYMVPGQIVWLAQMPLTANGKIDRRGLPAPKEGEWREERSEEKPETEREKELARIWEEVLGVKAVGRRENFFALGGDSIISLQVVARARQAGWRLTLRQVFQYPTVAQLAALEAQEAGVSTEQLADAPASHLSSMRSRWAALEQTLGSKQPVEAIYPLSPMQQGLLFHTLYAPGQGDYIIQIGFRLQGILDEEVFVQAWQQAIAHHAMLRTAMLWEGVDEPVQVVYRYLTVPVVIHDWREKSETEQRQSLQTYLQADRAQGFVLSKAPLMRLSLIRLDEVSYECIWSHHHILLDGWSLPLVLNDVLLSYETLRQGQAPQLRQVRPYQEYVDWLLQQDLHKAEAFWRQTLSGFLTPTPLGIDRGLSQQPGQQQSYQRQVLSLPVEMFQALQRFARQHHLTLNTIMQGAWGVLLSHYSGLSDVVFGAVFAGRPPEIEDIESMVGLFINTLPVRVRLSPDDTVVSWLQRLQEQQTELRQYEYSPLVQVQAWSEVPRGTSLFESVFIFENYPISSAGTEGEVSLRLQAVSSEEQTTYPLTVVVRPRAGLLIEIQYEEGRFAETAIARLLEHLRTFLENILAYPAQPVVMIPCMTPAEQQRLLHEWSPPVARYPAEGSLHRRFEEWATRLPDTVAVRFEQDVLSYGELNRRANRLAHTLRRLGVGSGTLVGLCVERSLELVIGILSILKAGGAYVPLDPNYPKERLAFYLEDGKISVVLSQHTLQERLPEYHGHLLYLDSEAGQFQWNETSPSWEVESEQPAYVIYTSGSTGQPKGVQVSHANVLRLFAATDEWYHFGPDDVWTLFHSYAFDFSVWELWGALLYGGTLAVVPYWISRSPVEFCTLLESEQVTVLNQTPSAFRQVQQILLDGPQVKPLALRWVIFGGEALQVESLLPWVERFGEERPRLVNMYGITETTVHVTYRPLSRSDCEAGAGSVIGRAIPDLRLYVLDRWMQPVPVGISGELYIGGAGLSRGYLNRGSLTSERFIADPYSRQPGQRLYRTGDLARYREDGELEYLGRIDEQVKVRGFRIELGEIESALKHQPYVKDAVVIMREDSPGNKRLVGYIVQHEPGQITMQQLRAALGELLPDYMVPAILMPLDALPLTVNGKLDRRALMVPDQAAMGGERTALVVPQTQVEETLARIWGQVLGVEQVGINDNFFALGGDSILSIQIGTRAAQVGLRLTPKLLFQHQTIAELAAVMEIIPEVTNEQGLVTGDVPLLPMQRWFFAQQQPQMQHWNQAVLLSTRHALDPDLLKRSIEHILLHHDALRSRFLWQNQQWRQTLAGMEGDIPIEVVDLSALEESERREALETRAAEAQATLHLETGPLVRVIYFVAGDTIPGRLLIVIHHLAVDGVSWRILLEDIAMAYEQLSNGQEVRLPAKTTSIQQWSQRLHEYAQSMELRHELPYWLARARHRSLALPVDYQGGENTVAASASLTVSLSIEETRALLQDVPQAYHTQINDVLLTALARAMNHWRGSSPLLVNMEGHGREEILEGVDVSRTVGWFTSLYPILLDLDEQDQPGEALKSIKEQLRAIPQRGIGYGLLRYLCADTQVVEQMSRLSEAELSFNYLGQFDQTLSNTALLGPALESSGPPASPLGYRQHLLDISGSISSGQLHLTWTYSQNLHHAETISRLAQQYVLALREIIAHCRPGETVGYTPSDFPEAELNQKDLDQIINRLKKRKGR